MAKKGVWTFLVSLAMVLGAIALPLSASAAEIIDPSDLSGWYKYDHYYDDSYPTNGAVPTDWDSKGGKHPYYYHKDSQATSTTVYRDIATINASVLPSGEIKGYFAQHIWVEGSRSDAVLTFVGYGVDAITDFLLYPTASLEVKVIGFDIDAARIDIHTLSGLGALVNAGIDSSGNLNGYLVYYKFATSSSGTVHLVKLSNVSAANLHKGSASINYSGGISLGSFSMSSGSTKMRLEMEILPTELTVTQTPYDSSGNLGTSQVLKAGYALDNTGANGFGPLVDYVSHACKSLSYVKFSNMLMTINYSVLFDSNGGDTEANPTSIDDIKPGEVIGTLPAPPKKTGYVFTGWNTNKDGSGAAFTADSVVNKNTTVYAQWQKIDDFIDIKLSYEPDSVWTNGDVTVKYEITCPVDDIVEVVIDGKEVTLTPGETITGTFAADKNGTYPIEVITKEGGTKTDKAVVTWIDKEPPAVSGLPNVTSNGDVLTGNSFGSVTYADPTSPGASVGSNPIEYASGVNDSTKTLQLYDAATGNLVKEIPMSDLAAQWSSIPSGEYYYDIKVEDNVGNPGYASDAYGGNKIGSGGTGGGNPVIINPSGPVIRETGRSTPESEWSNGDVTINYTVTGDVTLNTITITGPNGFSQTIDNVNSKNFNGSFDAPYNGNYTITAVDKSGASVDYPLTVKIDKNPPTLTMNLTNGGKLETGKISYSDTLEDASNGCSGIESVVVTITNPNTGAVIATGSDPDTAIDALSSGTYNITVTVTDKAGNSTFQSANNVTIGGSVINPNIPGPAIAIVGGDAKLNSLTTANSSFTFRATDVAYGFDSPPAVQVLNNNGNPISITVTPIGTTIAQVTVPTGLAAGNYTIQAVNMGGGVTTKPFTVK